MVSSLTADQISAILAIERVCSVISLLGCASILATFAFSRRFRKPINRLVFYASVGNILTNTATLIGRSATGDVYGFVCQAQAFLIQVFLCADSYWTLAMACNVYLTFFHKYDADRLRTMEKYYFVCCYAIPLIPAIVCLFLNVEGKPKVFGDATLWCWITPAWDYLRIATFYGPVWVAMFITFIIYLRAGKEIYTRRKQLQRFQNIGSNQSARQFTSTKTTEVHVTSETATRLHPPIDLSDIGDSRTNSQVDPDRPAYSVSVFTQQQTPRLPASPTFSNTSYYESKEPRGPASELLNSYHIPARRNATMEANNAAWSYTKVAVLFFTAMLVTWIPSSANRLYSVVNANQISPPLLFASSFVLPLQGFWNSVIYFTTSWSAVVALFSDWGFCGRRALRRDGAPISTGVRPQTSGGASVGTRAVRRPEGQGRSGKNPSTSSMAELASRPATRESDES